MSISKYSPQLIQSDRNGHSWHTLDKEQVVSKLATRFENGLTRDEAVSRLAELGLNQPKKRRALLFGRCFGSSSITSSLFY